MTDSQYVIKNKNSVYIGTENKITVLTNPIL
jgi:hypothetical protein